MSVTEERRPGLMPFPGAWGLMSWSLAARLHVPSTTIAATLLVTGWGGSYAWAGATVAGLTAGQGIGGPVSGLLIDRLRAPVVLAIAAALFGLGASGLAVLPAGWHHSAPLLALLVGVTNPPAAQLARRTWSRRCLGDDLDRVYRLEASGQEVLFIVSPVLVASAGVVFGGAAAMLTIAAFAVVGNFGFAARVARLPAAEVGAAEQSAAGDARHDSRGILLVVLATAFVMAAITMIDLSLVAWARSRGTPVLAGAFAAAWAAGSLAGGLAAVLVVRLRPGVTRRLLWMAAGFAALVPAVPATQAAGSPWLVAAVLLLGGVTVAPAFGALYSATAALSSPARRGEAFGWQAVGVTVGAAAAAPLAGRISDITGPRLAVGVATVLCLSAGLTLLPLAARRRETAGPLNRPAPGGRPRRNPRRAGGPRR